MQEDSVFSNRHVSERQTQGGQPVETGIQRWQEFEPCVGAFGLAEQDEGDERDGSGGQDRVEREEQPIRTRQGRAGCHGRAPRVAPVRDGGRPLPSRLDSARAVRTRQTGPKLTSTDSTRLPPLRWRIWATRPTSGPSANPTPISPSWAP